MSKTQTRVAVIGAGAAGLATAAELLRERHAVTVFEIGAEVGGTWVYTEETEAEAPFDTPNNRILGSMYDSLRTNLPRNIMSFDDYPFDSRGGGDDTWPMFPGHKEVLTYLRRFAQNRNLLQHIRFKTPVDEVEYIEPTWRVNHEVFDAVAVCNGHYSEPDMPAIEGASSFPGHTLHSHNYRTPKILAEHCGSLADKSILLLGAGPSGIDISMELAKHAKHVYLSGERFNEAKPPAEQKTQIKFVPPLTGIEASKMHCGPTTVNDIDVLIYCTGYRYNFPFLPTQSVDDGWVHDLYQQLLPISAPSLAFIGLCFRIVPFPFFQRQARWFSRLLAGQFELPLESERRASHEHDIAALRANGVPPRHTHALTKEQYVSYLNRLALQCGDSEIPEQFSSAWAQHFQNVINNPSGFRKANIQDANLFLWPD